jgi:diguanylate cyclase (GGDEF)-like protein
VISKYGALKPVVNVKPGDNMPPKPDCENSETDLCRAYCQPGSYLCEEVSRPTLLTDTITAAAAKLAITETELSVAQSEARTDELTELLNRRGFIEKAHLAIAQAELVPAGTTSLGLLIMDVTGLKKLNDTRGHEAGDALLREVGKSLHKIRFDDKSFCPAARLGGDEFGALVSFGAANSKASNPPKSGKRSSSRTPLQQLSRFAERLKLDLDAVMARHGSVEIAIGAAMWAPGMTFEDLFAYADGAMYRNKSQQQCRPVEP